MSKLWKGCAVAILLLPVAALADLSGTVTLAANTAINLDTGATSSSGGDLLWSGSTLTPQGKAQAASLTALGLTGATTYGTTVTQALLQEGLGLGLASSSPISGLAVDTIIGVATNGGNVAKMLVTAMSGTSITFEYTTYGASSSGGTAPPTITEVQNNYSYIVPGLPNYGIAPGTLFIIKGTNMASTTTVSTLESSAAPGIPLILNGASVSVTVNGTTVVPGMYYAIATQIAAVLPSNTPVGTGTITVSYNNTPSNSASITVVESALGLDTYYGAGTGLGVATDLSYNVFNYNKSASPGQNIILWGSGLGADTADSDTTLTATPHAVNVPLTIYVGGIAVTPAYAGSSGYPGLNQINLTIPASVATGCGVAIIAVSGSVVSNTVTLPIAAGGGVCSDPLLGYNGTQLLTLGGKSTYNNGSLLLLQSTSQGKTLSAASAGFLTDPGSNAGSGSGLASLNSCVVSSSSVSTGTVTTLIGLDAGTVSVTGPTGTQALTEEQKGEYGAQLASGFIPATGGSFTFTGTGGADVGAFTASISYSNPLSWTNMSAISAITRAQGVNMTWSGGAANTYVYISGSSSSSTASASFTCDVPVGAGQFTVPSYILLALPAGSGNLGMENATTPASFSATGLDSGVIFAGVGFSVSPTYN